MTPPDERLGNAFTIRGFVTTPDDPEGQPFRASYIRGDNGDWDVSWRFLVTKEMGRVVLPHSLPAAEACTTIAQIAAQRDHQPR